MNELTVLTEHQQRVFTDRYALKDGEGNAVETDPSQMWKRVAKAIGSTKEQKRAFLELLRDFKFVPGGRILAGAGTGTEVTFYNCYVIPVETKTRRGLNEARAEGIPDEELRVEEDSGSDSREAIFDTIGLMVDIMSRGGGVGINWSVLRPKNSYLKRVNGKSSGPIGWMDVASKAVGEVEQGGSRRGAAMFMLDDWHPDVLEFINAKRDFSRITNANVSVAVSDEFMEAVKLDGEWELVFPDTSDPAYNTRWAGDLAGWRAEGLPVRVHSRVRARDIWKALATSAHASGEPGVVFLGRYNELSTGRDVERLISVNPCGEQGLGAYSVCNLGAMNLDAYVRNGTFDWDAFGVDVTVAIDFLDEAIDKNYYFIPENEKVQKGLRRVGLSVMGLADALMGLCIRYGSKEAVDFTDAVFAKMKVMAIRASISKASDTKYGPAPFWKRGMAHRPYFEDLDEITTNGLAEYGLRNLFLLTQAPTGTTSLLANVNSGIEPLFALRYRRVDRTGEHWVDSPAVTKYVNPAVDYSSEDWLVTAEEVTVEEHIAMQAAVQRHVDSSVSKTINAPNEQTVEDVEKAFTLAYEMGLKGLAYFRDGSGRDQVLYREEKPADTSKLDEVNQQLADALNALENKGVFNRPDLLTGETAKVRTAAGTAYVTVNRNADGRPVEVFINVGKAGSDVMELGEALGRLISLALRHGASLGGVANQLEGIGGYSAFNKPLASALGASLTTFNRGTVPTVPVAPTMAPVYESKAHTGQSCPDCKQFSVVNEEGCMKCYTCGWSAC